MYYRFDVKNKLKYRKLNFCNIYKKNAFAITVLLE